MKLADLTKEVLEVASRRIERRVPQRQKGIWARPKVSRLPLSVSMERVQ